MDDKRIDRGPIVLIPKWPSTAYFKGQGNLTKDGDYGLIALDVNYAGTHYYANFSVWTGADLTETVSCKFSFAEGVTWSDVVDKLVNFSIAYQNSSQPATNKITLTDEKTNELAWIEVDEPSSYDLNPGKTFFFTRS